MGLSSTERQQLLRVARLSVAAKVGALPSATVLADEAQADVEPTAVLCRHAGAFVTLRVGDVLRGCIGHVEVDRSLIDVVRCTAVAAATEDPRFVPLTADEFRRVTFEISVLGPLETCLDLGRIEVGRHGLVVVDGVHRGLLLPQVAMEWGWDAHTFLVQTCQKAGLPHDAWKTGATVFTFEAEVFQEKA